MLPARADAHLLDLIIEGARRDVVPLADLEGRFTCGIAGENIIFYLASIYQDNLQLSLGTMNNFPGISLSGHCGLSVQVNYQKKLQISTVSRC